MAITLTRVKDSEDVWGKHRVIMYDITLDSSYPTGGEAVAAKDIGLADIRGAQVLGVKDATSGGIQVRWNHSTKKLMAFRTGAHSHDLLLKNAAVVDGATTRVNAGTNLLGANTGSDITVAGGGANGGVQNSVQGALAEVTAAVDLSGVTARVLFIGI